MPMSFSHTSYNCTPLWCVFLHSSLMRWHLCCWGRPALLLVCSVSGPAVWSCLYCSHSGSRYEQSNHQTWDRKTYTGYWTFGCNAMRANATNSVPIWHWFLFKASELWQYFGAVRFSLVSHFKLNQKSNQILVVQAKIKIYRLSHWVSTNCIDVTASSLRPSNRVRKSFKKPKTENKKPQEEPEKGSFLLGWTNMQKISLTQQYRTQQHENNCLLEMFEVKWVYKSRYNMGTVFWSRSQCSTWARLGYSA